MQYKTGDIWDLAKDGWIVVTTNTEVKKNGRAVMGAGIAKEAAIRFPNLPKDLGNHIQLRGDMLYVKFPVICFPTKHDWRESSKLEWIEKGCKELSCLDLDGPIYLPRLGCGLGGLNWEREVRPVVDSLLEGDRFILVSQP